ncbi:hypothetical protein INR49_025788 [Caranx melampygus]|nr:hypothetical protein INR49_025788 [Caranx melampygus]
MLLLLLLLLLLLMLMLLLLLGCQRERLILLQCQSYTRVVLETQYHGNPTVIHSDLLPLGDVSDGNNDQPHLAATVDLSDAAVGEGGKELAVGAGAEGVGAAGAVDAGVKDGAWVEAAVAGAGAGTGVGVGAEEAAGAGAGVEAEQELVLDPSKSERTVSAMFTPAIADVPPPPPPPHCSASRSSLQPLNWLTPRLFQPLPQRRSRGVLRTRQASPFFPPPSSSSSLAIALSNKLRHWSRAEWRRQSLSLVSS